MLLILKLYICEIFERKRQKGASNMWKFIKCKEADGPEDKLGGGLCVCNNGEKRVCLKKLLAQAGGIPVGRHLGGRLATTLVATINVIIGTSVRRSSRSAFWRSTGNDVVATIDVIIFFFSSFLFFSFFFFFFLRRLLFL